MQTCVMAATASGSATAPWLAVLAPSLVTLAGVLFVASYQVRSNRNLLAQQLKLQQANQRRELYGRYLAAVEERRSLSAEIARLNRQIAKVTDAADRSAYTVQLNDYIVRRRLADRRATTIRLEVEIESGTDSTAIGLMVKLPRMKDNARYNAAREEFVAACRADVVADGRSKPPGRIWTRAARALRVRG